MTQLIVCISAKVARFVLTFTVLSSGLVFAQGPIVKNEQQHDVSRPLRDLAATPPTPATAPREAEEIKLLPLPSGFKPANQPDLDLQRTPALAPVQLSPAVGLNFEGLGTGFPNYVVNAAPPDTNGAVGKTQYVQWVNTDFAVFDKTTGNVLAN